MAGVRDSALRSEREGEGGTPTILAEEAVGLLLKACPGMEDREARRRLEQAIQHPDAELRLPTIAPEGAAKKQALLTADLLERRPGRFLSLHKKLETAFWRNVKFPRREFDELVSRQEKAWTTRRAEIAPHWSFTAAVAWLLGRDLEVVRDLGRYPSAIDKGAVLARAKRLSPEGIGVEAATDDLRDALAAGRIKAWGAKGETDAPLEEIPAAEWSRASMRWRLVDGDDRAGPYRDVVIESRAVRELWPDGQPQRRGEAVPTTPVGGRPSEEPQVPAGDALKSREKGSRKGMGGPPNKYHWEQLAVGYGIWRDKERYPPTPQRMREAVEKIAVDLEVPVPDRRRIGEKVKEWEQTFRRRSANEG